MSSDKTDGSSAKIAQLRFDSVEYLLFDSLVHHLIEKGLLTKNDALSVVQTAAEVVRGQMHEDHDIGEGIAASLAMLERTYLSFEALGDRQSRTGLAAGNVHRLRAPLHNDHPHFPTDDDD